MLHLFKQSTTFNGDSWSLIDKGIFYRATFNFKYLTSLMFTKIYLTIAIVLRCYKKCLSFLWYFDGNSPVIICKNYVCLFLLRLFSSLKLLIGFRFQMHRITFYTGHTFPISIMSVFKTKFYMEHLCSLFWFLLPILSISASPHFLI